MSVVEIRGLSIGEGMPKICVPIVEKTKEDILRTAREIYESVADLAEWRADWFQDVFESEAVLDVLKGLREILKEKPLLFTFRTKEEGGEREIGVKQYVELNETVLKSGNIDLLDVEVFGHPDAMKVLLEVAREHGVKIIGSNHDFIKTPPKDEIVRRLRYMQSVGVDIAKIAVMPQEEEDVQTLLEATREVSMNSKACPVVTMSMSSVGAVSRFRGEEFGSVITFGTLQKASAPGQIHINELKKELEKVHKIL